MGHHLNFPEALTFADEGTKENSKKCPDFLEVYGDDEYNNWSIQLANKQREPGQKVVYIKVKGLKPPKSRLIKPEIVLA